ncbi:hypothetical protein B7760_04828 [Burkholderia glumae]|nr:hypothetical protein B7760_04828 [Burkholderia glumae]
MSELNSNPALEETSVARTRACLGEIWSALGGAPDGLSEVGFKGHGVLPSAFHVTDFASASIAAAAHAVAELIGQAHGARPAVEVDRRYASLWFQTSLRPQGWQMPPQWDVIAGDYRTADGWIRLHTNAPHHRDAALAVLGTPLDKDAVAREVARWKSDELESAVVSQHGCAAALHTQAQWAEHPQGRAVQAEPLLIHDAVGADAPGRAGRFPPPARCMRCWSSTSRAFWRGRWPRGFSPAMAPMCCASIRSAGKSPTMCRKWCWASVARASTSSRGTASPCCAG